MNRSGLAIVAVMGWIIVAGLVGWFAGRIVEHHKADTAMVDDSGIEPH